MARELSGWEEGEEELLEEGAEDEEGGKEAIGGWEKAEYTPYTQKLNTKPPRTIPTAHKKIFKPLSIFFLGGFPPGAAPFWEGSSHPP